MLISIIITAEEAGKQLSVESSSEGKVKFTLGVASIEVEGNKVERGITNALNLGVEVPSNFAVQTTISEPEANKFLVIENHPSDKNKVVVKIASESCGVNGRELSTAVRHCS